jgi:hypothetical protein
MRDITKIIKAFRKTQIGLEVLSTSRQDAWTEITNLGAVVEGCDLFDDRFSCRGWLDGGLIRIEQLERDGWTWK